jgi:hypothetical protein
LAPTGQAAVSTKRVLRLYGEGGKRLVTLTDDLQYFHVLEAEIRRRMAEHPSPQRDGVALGKVRRKGLLMVLAGVVFLGLALVNAWIALHDRESAQLLATQGRPSEAIVVRKFIAPDGRTRRIEYRVDVAGAPVENVEVEPLLWELLQERQRVPVISVPGRPDVSRLAAGQVDDSMHADPRLMLVASAVMGVFSAGIIVAGILGRRGLTVKWDAQRGRPRIVQVTEA